MKGLIKKDLLNLSSYKTTLFITVFFCSIALISTEAISFAPIVICTIIGMIALSTFNYDESSKSEQFILSLPLTKKEIVLSKYILAIVSTILGGLLGSLLTIIVVSVKNAIQPEAIVSLNYESLFINTLAGMFGITLIQSIQIPSIYKWGAEKGRIQMFVLLFIGLLAILGLGFLFTKSGLSIETQQIQDFFQHFGVFLLIALIIVMYTISYRVSYHIFRKKEV